MSVSYKIALAADIIAALVALYFIISDGYKGRSDSNGALSLATLVFCTWIAVSFFLHQHGYKGIASAMAWIPAIPILGYGLMILLFVIFKPDMR
ncbi:MAG: hypothetical protein SFV22_09155 [Saprospiraceae bacterium]|nr:hypothetical protein [Saprospiraceae bacterium]